jgi:hypothetical protein
MNLFFFENFNFKNLYFQVFHFNDIEIKKFDLKNLKSNRSVDYDQLDENNE